jgi:hypothetical protein
LALAKEIAINERMRANSEAKFLNAFNRVQFAPPALQVASSTFGVVSGTLNNPRQVQFSMRLLF